MQSFKSKAEQHLKNYVSERNVTFHSYCILHDEDVIGHQFVQQDAEFIIEVENRRRIYDKSNKVKAQFKNMLRSEHIAFNLFVPLKLRKERADVIEFFRHLLKRNDLRSITEFEIEWAPNVPKKALDDKTSFDTYIQFELNNGKKLGAGIEVKYTEKSYPFTKTESDRLKDQSAESPYYKIWSNPISIYKPDTYLTLGEKCYKQFFRNHLLGLSMIKNGELDEFISVHLYPSGNSYQDKYAKLYGDHIQTPMQHTFLPITFERFIEVGKGIFKNAADERWLDYLSERYIVK